MQSLETLPCLTFQRPRSTSFTFHWFIHQLQDQSSQVSSWCRLGLNLLSHLFGTVVGQTQAHDGQHHGYLVDGTVLWLSLHLTGYLPLQKEEKRNKGGTKGQKSANIENNEPCLSCQQNHKSDRPNQLKKINK